MSLSAYQTVFSGNKFDRADQLRTDPAVMTSWRLRDDARFVLFIGDRVHSQADGSIAWVSAQFAQSLKSRSCIFLGLERNAPRYAMRLEDIEEQNEMLGDDKTKFRDLRACALKLGHAHPDLACMAQAKSMMDWHDSHKHCATCGAESVLTRAGYERKCTNQQCGASHFPRTDPVVIMLAVHDGKALVGQNVKMPPGWYSALAGFLEPGETIEEATARELYEEAGVTATSVRYIASQPWPWPSSLMIATIADVDGNDIKLDQKELVTARWITKKDALAALKGDRSDLMLPPPLAIAHTLIQAWANE